MSLPIREDNHKQKREEIKNDEKWWKKRHNTCVHWEALVYSDYLCTLYMFMDCTILYLFIFAAPSFGRINEIMMAITIGLTTQATKYLATLNLDQIRRQWFPFQIDSIDAFILFIYLLLLSVHAIRRAHRRTMPFHKLSLFRFDIQQHKLIVEWRNARIEFWRFANCLLFIHSNCSLLHFFFFLCFHYP